VLRCVLSLFEGFQNVYFLFLMYAMIIPLTNIGHSEG
jgi:hypothetical protein